MPSRLKNKKPGKGWPPERRQKQAERIRAQKPWESSTGPRTAEGKAAVGKNPRLHGFRSDEFRKLRAAMKRQRSFVKKINALSARLLADAGRQQRENMVQSEPS